MLFWNRQQLLNVSRHTYDQFLNEDGLADTSTTEETNLSTTRVRSQKVNNLDASDQNLGRRGLLNELGRIGVDAALVFALDGATLVDRVASDVHDAAEGGVADRNHDGASGVDGGSTTDKTFGTCKVLETAIICCTNPLTVHGNASHHVFTQMLLRQLATA
jgi:hypothetical protein